MSKELAVKDVYLYWPEDDKWYRANVEKIFFQTSSAYIHYPDDDTYEEINLKQLIKDKHIAFIETKGKSMKLRQGEKPVEDDGTAVYFESDEEPDSSEDVGSDDWVDESDLDDEDEDDDEMSQGAEDADQEDEIKEKALKGKTQKQELSLAEQARRSQDKPSKRSLSKPAAQGNDSGPPAPPGLQPLKTERDSLASKSQSRPGSVAKQFSASTNNVSRASSMVPSLNRTGASSKLSSAPSISSRGSGALLPSSDEEMRKKARDQLIAALTLAIDEVKKRGLDEKCVDGTDPDAAQAKEVGTRIEAELFGLQDELSSVYKSKFRSLIFNLKDIKNELRLRVLFGDISPSSLVRMEAIEMASASMSAWRQKKAEEQAKSKFLSTEAAAKFSTAAAAQLAETQEVSEKQPLANIEIPLARDEPGSGVTSSATMDELEVAAGSFSPSHTFVKRNNSDSLPSHVSNVVVHDSSALDQRLRQEPKVATLLAPAISQRVTLKSMDVSIDPAASIEDPPPFDLDDDYFASTYESSDADNVQHLIPLLGAGAGDLLSTTHWKLGDEIWSGSIGGQIDHGVVSSLRCSFLGGLGDLPSMMGGSSTLEVKGTVRGPLERYMPLRSDIFLLQIKMAALETFLEDLRMKSKTRIATLGHIRSSVSANEGMGKVFSDLVSVYSSSAKAGVCHPLPGLEGYLLCSSPLARRLIKTVRLSLPSNLNQLINLGSDLGPHELLLVVVHRKDFNPPRVIKPLPSAPSAPTGHSAQPAGRPFDPRSRGQADDSQRPYDPRAKASTVSLPPPPPIPAPDPPLMSFSGLGALAAALGVKPDPLPPAPPSPYSPSLPSLDLSTLGALAYAVGIKSDPIAMHPPVLPVMQAQALPIPMTRSAPFGPYSSDYDRDFIHAMGSYQS